MSSQSEIGEKDRLVEEDEVIKEISQSSIDNQKEDNSPKDIHGDSCDHKADKRGIRNNLSSEAEGTCDQDELKNATLVVEEVSSKDDDETTDDFTTEYRDKIQNEYAECKKMEEKAKKANTIIEYEFQRVQVVNDELKKQSDGVASANSGIVEPEMEKLKMELQILRQENVSYCTRYATEECALNDLKIHLAEVQESQTSATALLSEKKDKWSKALKEPEKAGREVAAVKKSVTNLESELKIVQSQFLDLKTKIIIEEDSQKLETYERLNDTSHRLEFHQENLKRCQDTMMMVRKELEDARSIHHSLTGTSLSMELNLKEMNEKQRHEKTSEVLHKKQVERMNRLYTKKKTIYEETTELVEKFREKQQENILIAQQQEEESKELIKEAEVLKDKLNIKTIGVLDQENVEQSVKDELKKITFYVDKMEQEVELKRTEGKRLQKTISILKVQWDSKARKIQNIRNGEKEVLETAKLKRLLLLDFTKALNETNKRVREFTILIEAMRSEKEDMTKLTMTTNEALNQLRQKAEQYRVELQGLQCEHEKKSNIFRKEKDSHETSRASRAMLRVERNKMKSINRDKQEETRRKVLNMKKLKSKLACLKRDLARMETRNKRSETSNRMVSEELDDKKNEIHRLLQRSNAYEESLKKGELSMQQRKEEIRELKIQRDDVERHVNTTRSLYGDTKEYEEKLLYLQKELDSEVKQRYHLTAELTDQFKSCELREVSSYEDPDQEQLAAKTAILLQRLSDNKEQLLERDLLMEEVESCTNELRKEFKMTSVKTQPAMKKLNDCQHRVREITRSMMALISELSMYHATALKLQQDRDELEEEHKRCRERVIEGKPPNDDALKELKNIYNKEKHERYYDEQSETKGELGRKYYPAKYSLRTTAEPRDKTYHLPEIGMEKPKPYGMTPFHPVPAK